MTERGAQTTAIDACIGRYIAWLRSDREEVGSCIREAILVETPEYALLEGDEAVRWADGIDSAVATLIDGGIDGRALTPAEQAVMESIGRDRADRGLALAAIVASIAVAARVVRDWPARHLSTGASAEEQSALTMYSERVTTFANRITDAILAGYLARTGERTTTPEQDRARLFDAIYSGRAEDDAAIRRGAALGCDLVEPWVVVVIPFGAGPAVDVLEQEVLAMLPGAVVVPRATATTPHTALAVPVDAGAWETTRTTLATVVEDQKAVLLVSGPCTGPRQLHRRYRTARTLLAQVGLLTRGGPMLLDTADHADTALFAGVEALAGVSYADDVLGPIDRLPRPKARRLFRTLDALVTNDGSAKRAAGATGQHVKTVYRHMSEIEEATGRYFDCFGDLFRFRVAVILRKMSTETDISGSKMSARAPMTKRVPLGKV